MFWMSHHYEIPKCPRIYCIQFIITLQCVSIRNYGSESVVALHKPWDLKQHLPASTCLGYGISPIQLAEHNAQPTTRVVSIAKRQATLQVCRKRAPRQQDPSMATNITKLFNIHHMASSDPAPLIAIC